MDSKCGNCGTTVADDSAYCGKCGARVDQEDRPAPESPIAPKAMPEGRVEPRRCPACMGVSLGSGSTCEWCHAPMDKAWRVNEPGPTPRKAIITPENRSKWVLGGIAALVFVALLSVGGTKDQCVRRRMDVGEFSYASEMLGGASGSDVQARLTDRLRCPLGFSYSSDLVCPVHGALTKEDKDKVLQETRGVYGY